MPPSTAKPFSLAARDLSKPAGRKAAMWSKILPFVLLLWSLTGAFYPAVDLCAGEKERGTLETLLSSPAERSEIVWGKLLTVMVFSMTTALLNLLSMCVIGSLVLRQLDLGPPPALSILWLLIALIPTSALFSGLCLSLAAFARSTKEGQYYLMPLVLITMPLAILPMAPGVELNLGNSVIPVTGLVLLLRTLLEDDYAHALPYVPIVVGVTLTCCLLAVRWAADQFNSESVLFRESERLDMGLWLRRLVSDREPTPSVGEAIFCGVTILTIKFLMGLALPPTNPAWSSDQKFQHFFELVMVVQLAVIATPALLMAIMLTSDKRQTLLLRMPAVSPVFAALALAVAVHPLVRMLGEVVQRMYPLSDEIRAELNNVLDSETAPIGLLLLAVAVVPAICEELAFRGFILSGLRHMGHKWRAIAISSIFFGITHAVFQQSLVACLLGAVIGFLAVQTGSLLPGVVFHMTNNGLSVLVAKYLPDWLERSPHSTWLATIHQEEGATELVFAPWLILISAALVTALLFWFHRLPYARSEEEALQETIEHQAAQPVT